MVVRPSLRVELGLLRSGVQLLAGMDEVGRGALAGPVTVGVVVVDVTQRTAPAGLRDSKLLNAAERARLAPRVRRWARASAVGHASPAEIDRWGIIAALRLAGHRALASLPVRPDHVLLDGNHDWLTPPQPAATLFDEDGGPGAPVPASFGPDSLAPAWPGPDSSGWSSSGPGSAAVWSSPGPGPGPGSAAGWAAAEPWAGLPPVAVTTRIKADMSCSAVAAASVLAKTDRDAIMVSLAAEHEAYGWQDNKGYAAPEHIAALREHGPCLLHRRSWSLPGTGSSRSAAGQVAVPEIGPATSLDPATLALPDVEWADSIEVTA